MKARWNITGTFDVFADYVFEQIRLWLNREIIKWITHNTSRLTRLILMSPT
jgi:hypothetical protein